MWEKMAEDRHFTGCLIGNSAAELAYTDPEVADRIAGYIRALEDAFHETLVKAREAGEITTPHDPRDLARAFINMFQGVALLSKVLKDPEMSKGVIRSSMYPATALSK